MLRCLTRQGGTSCRTATHLRINSSKTFDSCSSESQVLTVITDGLPPTPIRSLVYYDLSWLQYRSSGNNCSKSPQTQKRRIATGMCMCVGKFQGSDQMDS